MNAAVTDVLLHDLGVRSRITAIGVIPDPSTPDEFAAIVKVEIGK